MKPTKFIKKQYLWTSFKERVLPYLTDKKLKIKLKKYILPKNMNNTEIKTATNSTPIDVKYFASILQNFLETASKDKWYIFYIKTPKEVVAVYVHWHGGEWNVIAHVFDYRGLWDAGDVFLFPATDTLETRIKKLEIEHCSEPKCPACNLVAYKRGRKDMANELIKKIKKLKEAVRTQTGSFKYDDQYDDILSIIEKLKK